MSCRMREWVLVVAFAAITGAMLGAVVWTKWPTCRPGDGGIVIGGVILMGGCQ